MDTDYSESILHSAVAQLVVVSVVPGHHSIFQTSKWNDLIFEKNLQLVNLREFRHHSIQTATGATEFNST